MATLLLSTLVTYLSIVNSQPSNYEASFNDLVVGDYVIIKASGGYLRDNEDGSTLITSSTFDDTATWQVTNDFSSAGIEFKNTKTGNYIKGDGTDCFVGSLGGSGNWGAWQQGTAGTFDNDQLGRCCCVDSANDNTITHGSCGNSCAQFTFYVVGVPSFRTITSFNSLNVGDYVIIESASGFGGYLTDKEDGSTLVTESSNNVNSAQIWEVTNDFSSAGIEFKNTKTGLYIKGDGTNCFVGSLGGSGNWGGWQQATSGTFDNDQLNRCCCVNSADDNTITHGSCGNSCAQFVFHVIGSLCSSSSSSDISSPPITVDILSKYWNICVVIGILMMVNIFCCIYRVKSMCYGTGKNKLYQKVVSVGTDDSDEDMQNLKEYQI